MAAVVKPTPKTYPSSRNPYGVNNRRPAAEQQRVDQVNKRLVETLKHENADLKKGQNNLQTVTELKYVKARISSLELQIVGKNTEIATLKAKLEQADKDAKINQETIERQGLELQRLEEQLEVQAGAADIPQGPGATSPAID